MLSISFLLLNSSILKSRFTMSSDMLVIEVLSFLLIFLDDLVISLHQIHQIHLLYWPFYLWMNQSLIKRCEPYFHQLKVFRYFHCDTLMNDEKHCFLNWFGYEVLDKYNYLLQQNLNKVLLWHWNINFKFSTPIVWLDNFQSFEGDWHFIH